MAIGYFFLRRSGSSLLLAMCFTGSLVTIYKRTDEIDPLEEEEGLIRIGEEDNVVRLDRYLHKRSLQDSHIRRISEYESGAAAKVSPEQDVKGNTSSARRLPQCIIIGVRKSGTRALLEYLDIHPQIEIAKEEMHFFDNDANYSLGLEHYRRRMPLSRPGQITIEKSPAYFVTPEAPTRIRQMNSSIKLLVVLRDPVERAISDYTQVLANRNRLNLTTPPFEHYAIDRVTGLANVKYRPLQISLYAEHMSKWLDLFPRDQVHFVDAERLVRDPIAEIADVEEFLGLRPFVRRSNLVFNSNRGFYCIKRSSARFHCLHTSKGRPHAHVDPAVKRLLSEYFAPYNEELFQMIGRRFNWS